MPERSRSPQGPRHLAPGSEIQPWWRSLDAHRLRIAVGATFLALPILVLDNLPEGSRGTAEAVETVAPPDTEPSTTSSAAAPTTSTTAAPTTTQAPTTTEPPTTAPPTTATPTTARPAAPPTTEAAPPPPEPTTTAPPPPPDPGSVEAVIHAHFGAAGPDAVEIARCESGLDPGAVGGGGRYFGLFQLGRDHAAAFQAVTGRLFDEAWSDAGANSQYAAWLHSRSGWAPWGCRDHV